MVADADGKTRIHVHAIDGVEDRPLPGTEGAVHLLWTPQGDSIAFVAESKLKQTDLASGTIRDVTEIAAPRQLAWNQNDDILVSVPAKGLSLISAKGGSPMSILDSLGGSFPVFLSDGRRFLVRVNRGNRSSIQLRALNSKEGTLVVDNVVSAPVLARTPRGKTYLLFLRESDLMAQEFDEASGKVLGPAVILIPRIGRIGDPPVMPAVGISPSGILAYQSAEETETRRLKWVDRSGVPTRIFPADAFVAGPRLGPDQRSVAGIRSTGGDRNVWVTDLVRESTERKTFDNTSRDYVVWSQDGSRLAYSTPSGIYAMDVKGGGKPSLVTETPGLPTSWSGQNLLYDFHRKMYLLDMNGAKAPVQVGSPNGESFLSEFSPDGNYIAFTSNSSGRPEVYIEPVPPAAGETRVSINGGGAPRWRGDGKEIFFVTPDGNLMSVDIKLGDTVSVGIPHKLFHFDSRNGTEVAANGYDVAKNGQRFLIVSASEETNSPITVVVNWWVELEQRLGR
jgi:Tol biopolymer transport system component